MSARSNVVLTDGTTPITHSPRSGSVGETSTFRQTGVPLDEAASVSLLLRDGTTYQVVRARRSVPIIRQDANGQNFVEGYYRATVEEQFPIGMTSAERAAECARTENLFSDAMYTDMRENAVDIIG